MWHNGTFYAVTNHGRARFVERLGSMSDKAMLQTIATGKVLNFVHSGCHFELKPDWKQRHTVRLITVYMVNALVRLEPIMDIQDRASEFTFNFSDFKRRFDHE